MVRILFLALLGLIPLTVQAQTEQQALVDRATLTVQELLTDSNNAQARKLMKNAKGGDGVPAGVQGGIYSRR